MFSRKFLWILIEIEEKKKKFHFFETGWDFLKYFWTLKDSHIYTLDGDKRSEKDRRVGLSWCHLFYCKWTSK